MTNDLINEIILDALCSDEPFVAAVPVVRGERIENKGRPKYSSCGLFCSGIDNPLDPWSVGMRTTSWGAAIWDWSRRQTHGTRQGLRNASGRSVS